MFPAQAAPPSPVSRALARDRLGVPAVLFFVLAGVAPLTVAAGVIPSAYATTGLTGIPAAFWLVAVILAVWATGYVPWWAWALAAWALVAVLGLARVDITGKVLGVLLTAEVIVIVAETAWGLARPAGGHLGFSVLSPAALTSAGPGTIGVLAVVAVLGFVGFEQAPVLAEEARHPRRTIPLATYLALGAIAVVYAGASWAMAAHAGQAHVTAAAAAQGPGLLFGLGSSGWLAQAAQVLFLTSLFAAALAFHNCVWRYMYALGRENVLPAALGRTGGNNIPKAASLAQSATGLAVIVAYAVAGWQPMTRLFFWLGTTGGFGVLILLALTAVAVIAFFARDPRGETAWGRLIAPALAAVLL